jgi:F-type H+-transporting ATPase subunit b
MTVPFQLSLFLLEAHVETGGLWDRIVHSNLINILLIVALLVWVAKKQNIPAALDAQRQKIAGELLLAQKQKQEAQTKLDGITKQTNHLQKEVAEILENAHRSAEALSMQIVSNARQEASTLIENAKKRVELEQRSAMKSLQARLLDEAIGDAREELLNTMTQETRAQSVEGFIHSLSSQGGHSNG